MEAAQKVRLTVQESHEKMQNLQGDETCLEGFQYVFESIRSQIAKWSQDSKKSLTDRESYELERMNQEAAIISGHKSQIEMVNQAEREQSFKFFDGTFQKIGCTLFKRVCRNFTAPAQEKGRKEGFDLQTIQHRMSKGEFSSAQELRLALNALVGRFEQLHRAGDNDYMHVDKFAKTLEEVSATLPTDGGQICHEI